MTAVEKLVRIIDSETTGVEDDAQVVEIASVDWTDGVLGNPMSALVKPTIPIPAIASAVHHIVDAMVTDAPPLAEVLPQFEGAPIYCAHNARFDQRFLPLKGHWICTYKVALRAWPDAPGHSNQVLRYWLDLAPLPPEAGEVAHRALYDAWTTARLFERLTVEMTVREMVEISSRPALLPCFRFGKHANAPLAEVPQDYLRWVLSQDFDEDVKHTASHHLGETT